MTVGETLTEARYQAGLSVDELSERTRIRGTVIRSIEQDDYEACGGDLYVRGYVRAIAGAVGIDAQPLIREYDLGRAGGANERANGSTGRHAGVPQRSDAGQHGDRRSTCRRSTEHPAAHDSPSDPADPSATRFDLPAVSEDPAATAYDLPRVPEVAPAPIPGRGDPAHAARRAQPPGLRRRATTCRRWLRTHGRRVRPPAAGAGQTDRDDDHARAGH